MNAESGLQSGIPSFPSVQPMSHEAAVVAASVTGRAILQMVGPESLDLLQRISTNNLSNSVAGACVDTVLTNEKGRIIDVVSVYVAEPNRLLLVCQSRNPDEIRSWLEKFIIMEDVKVTDVTGAFEHFLIMLTHEAVTEQDAFKSFKSEFLRLVNKHDSQAIVLEQVWNGVLTNHILIGKEAASLEMIHLVSERVFDSLRIRLGIPSHPQELCPAYNPLEANLQDKVSFTKGCYVGQEVIARLDTYKKLQRKLVRFAVLAKEIHAPSTVYSGAEEVGLMTSSASVGDSMSAGLGYIRLHSLGSDLHLKLGETNVPLRIL